jgi:hypothetical protein
MRTKKKNQMKKLIFSLKNVNEHSHASIFIESFIRIKSRLKLCGEPLLSEQEGGVNYKQQKVRKNTTIIHFLKPFAGNFNHRTYRTSYPINYALVLSPLLQPFPPTPPKRTASRTTQTKLLQACTSCPLNL